MIYDAAEDSYLLEKFVKKYSKNKSVLDMGTGTGIQALAAIQSGASKVLAADVNFQAVINARKLGIKAVQSRLFSHIKEKFDLIIFNPPYLPKDEREDKESALSTTGGFKGDEIIIKFLKNVKKHLNPHGFILLLVSSLTPRDEIITTLRKHSLKRKILAKKKLFMESIEVWKINHNKSFK